MHKKRKFRVIAIVACLLIAVSLLTYGSISGAFTKKERKPYATLFLYGNLSEMNTKQDVRSVTASFNSGDIQVSCQAAIKIQGTSSLGYDKKNYTISFYKDKDHQSVQNIDVGWGAENTYCLKANWIDKTHARNVVTAKLAAEVQKTYHVMDQAPCNGLIDGFPVAVYINDEFHGLYTWDIPKSAWMFGMDAENPDHIVLCGENWKDTVLFKDVPDFSSWSVEAGPENEETLSKFSRLIDFVMNSSDEAFKENFDQYMDLDAALDYYILVDFAYLPDNCGKNMLMVTYDGIKWYPSLYDLDTSWGTHYTGLELWDYENGPLNFGGTNNWARRLEENFSAELYERYFELRETLLTKEHVMDLFHAFDEQIPAEVKVAEIERWGSTIPGYDLTQIEDYLDIMIPMLDEKYQSLNP